jgi:outer membrane protein assembly factor BamB
MSLHRTNQNVSGAITSSRFLWMLMGCSVALSGLLAANWPQWRGPDRDGVSEETGLLQEWPEGGPPLVWQKSDLGDGYSTPAIVGDRLYLISNKGLENEFVQALEVETGEQIWQTRIGNVGNPEQRPAYPAARSTPTVDGDLLYALGSDGDLACIELDSGKIRWSKNVRTEFAGKFGEWAYSESPLIDGDKVVVTPGGEEATMLALDKKSGDVVWKCAVPGGAEAGYASIIIIDAAGVKQYIQFLGSGLAGVNADTGEFLWRYDRTAQGSPANIPTPIAKDGYIYSASSRGGGAVIRLVEKNGQIDVEEVYYDRKLPSAIGGAVLVDDHLYGTTRETMVCVEFKTGDVKWTQERGLAPASLVYADGNLYLHGERNNDVALVEATPEEYRERGRFSPPEPADRGRSQAWAYPAVADGRLYIHDWGTLWCYNVQADTSGN